MSTNLCGTRADTHSDKSVNMWKQITNDEQDDSFAIGTNIPKNITDLLDPKVLQKQVLQMVVDASFDNVDVSGYLNVLGKSILDNVDTKLANSTILNTGFISVDNELKEFNISNNDGASSSIFKFGNLSVGNESQWKERNLKMVDVIKLKSISLDTFVVENKIDIELYNHWVLDLQGAELLVLNGAENSLKKCKSIFIEVSQGEVYKDGAQWNEIKSFLHKKNFKNSWNIEGNHTSVLFKKIT